MTIAIAVEEAALEHVVDNFLRLYVEGGDEENEEEEFFHGCGFVKGIALEAGLVLNRLLRSGKGTTTDYCRCLPRNDVGLRNDGIASKQGILLPTSRDQDDGMENDHHLPEGLNVTWRKIV